MTTSASAQSADITVPGVALSREELYVVLRLLKAKDIPGFDTAWARVDARGEPTPETAEAVRAGMDALVARGWVQFTPPSASGAEPQVKIPAPVVALVGACAFSAFTVRFVGIDEGALRVFYFHQFGALGSLHSTPQPDIHLFMPLDGRQGLLKGVATMVGVADMPASGGQLGTIPLAALRDATRAARDHDGEGVRRALAQASVSADVTRQQLAQALASQPVWGELSVGTRDARGATVERDLFTLAANGIAFMFAPQAPDSSLLGVYAANVGRIRDWVGAQLPA